ncbi:MAG: LURP-one-related family protein, partial [Verrucomicrobiae bacterium]|nr:LURP-one-related family protein [Verrucomicrobiae bacterium]
MRYIVEARFWERGEDFHVCDHDGRPVFRVEGMAFSWGDKLSFQDLKQQELAFISQKLLSWMPRFRIYRDGTLVVEVLKES